jgi:DNA-binding NtrC family response regulator
MDHLFLASRLNLRFTDLTARNQRALLAHSWPDNLDELNKVIGWFAQILSTGSIRRAAAALKLPRSSLAFWLEQLKVKVPLTSSRDSRE